ncbi:Ni(II)/Co(II)-sensing metalloregulatory transcriptional repressor KmtR [Nonomuraea antimicrobica]|uniref:Ni(II)/Co(II)-sensing metalloregulatory transcriptional repressor KmtR n=1 Tax=Nonomuraea antimicrobica TaxID=561173 RepID=A0ABP7C0F1_9ACTN
MSVDAIVEVLKAIADPTRFQLLSAVSQRECGVRELAELVGAHIAAVSQHLAKLRAAGLVIGRRDGTRIFYRAANAQVAALLTEAGLLAGYVTGVIDPPDDGRGTGAVATAPQAARPTWQLKLTPPRPAGA